MASGHSDYSHGSMEISAQAGTFSGFMGGTKYGASALALIVLMPILVFCVHLAWLPSLIATVVFGILLGAGLKLKGGWYVGVVAAAIPVALLSFILTLLV